MANYTLTSYSIVYGTIKFGIKIPVLILDCNFGTALNSGDTITIPTSVLDSVANAVSGRVSMCGVFYARIANPFTSLGFSTGSYTCDDDSNLICAVTVYDAGHTTISRNNGFIQAKLTYRGNLLSYGGINNGGYASNDNYYCNPVFIIRNTFNNKIITFSSLGLIPGGYGVLWYGMTDPGLVNDGGIPVSYIYGDTVYTVNDALLTVSAEYDFSGFSPISQDPYSQDPDGYTSTGGGTGTFDGTGDDISIPSLPTLSAVDTGFITLFNPSISQLVSLANYMWDSSLFDVATWQKIFDAPMDAILGLTIVPVNVPSSGTGVVTVGNISTGVSMTKASSQYVELDCGTLNVEEYWGSYLDYDPYTKAEIYLPYCGTHALATDDIMGKAVHVVYHVDVLSGACCAYVQCGGTVLYSFIGQCASSIPITGNDMTNVINGVMSIAGSIGSMVATGGMSAPLAVANIASTAINGMKPNVEKSGAMGGTGGLLGVQTPYLILSRPRQALPENQNAFMGYPSFITESLSGLSGYTEIESIHLENVPATESELSEIENLLKSGVIF